GERGDVVEVFFQIRVAIAVEIAVVVGDAWIQAVNFFPGVGHAVTVGIVIRWPSERASATDTSIGRRTQSEKRVPLCVAGASGVDAGAVVAIVGIVEGGDFSCAAGNLAENARVDGAAVPPIGAGIVQHATVGIRSCIGYAKVRSLCEGGRLDRGVGE